jgi:ribosome biogenesis protein BMS1
VDLLKKPHSQHDGAFRATFEDKIKMSDIVFLRSWATVPLPKFYTPVTDKLLPPIEKWIGMKTVGRLRHELGIRANDNTDSHYRPVEKPEFIKGQLFIPKKLQRDLPYDLKPKGDIAAAKASYIAKKFKQPELIQKHTAVILEPHESRAKQLMQMLQTVSEDVNEKASKAADIRKRKHQKELAEINEKRDKKRKETQKTICRSLSKREKYRVKTALDEIKMLFYFFIYFFFCLFLNKIIHI